MIDNRYAERYIVDTPESIEFGYEIAGIAPRFLAATVDLSIFLLLGVLAYGIIDNTMGMSDNQIMLFLVQLGSLLYLVYYIAFERLWNGQTLGKRLFGLRVVQEAGKPIGLMSALIRNMIRLVDFFPALYSLGILFMFFDKRMRRFGDIVAGTIVVRDRQRVTLNDLLASLQTGKVASALTGKSSAVLPNIENIQYHEIQMVQEFLMQRAAMHPERRQRLAGQLSYGLFQRLGYSVPGDPELFLQQATDQYLIMAPRPSFEPPNA